MLSEENIRFLVFGHAIFGSLALLLGLMAMISKKGSILHKRFGRLFYYSMLLTAGLALLVSVLPNHESPFLFGVGVFSLYLVMGGFRAIRFKNKTAQLIDYIISWVMVITGILMISIHPLFYHKINIVLTAFGALGLFMAIQDLNVYRRQEKLRLNWQRMHLGKMTGAYISAVTAFIVVNDVLPGVIGWIAPGLIGGIFITMWSRKVSV